MEASHERHETCETRLSHAKCYKLLVNITKIAAQCYVCNCHMSLYSLQLSELMRISTAGATEDPVPKSDTVSEIRKGVRYICRFVTLSSFPEDRIEKTVHIYSCVRSLQLLFIIAVVGLDKLQLYCQHIIHLQN